MNEEEAKAWIADRFDVSRGTSLAALVDTIRTEATRQNLIAPSTLDEIWNRHIVDSAQLIEFAPAAGRWLDIGSGAGLPGLVIALLRQDPVELVEPRRLRTEFLDNAARAHGISNARIVTAKVERTTGIVDAITARAVAPLDKLFRMALHRSDLSTTWILPRGRTAHVELEIAQHAWQGSFHVEQSITAEDSLIVIAQGVRPR